MASTKPHSIGDWSLLLLGLLVGICCCGGCTSFVSKDTTTGKWPWSKAEPKLKLPTRILAIWTDAVHHQAGQKAQRGFGGRVVFYADGSEEPIQVDGTLTIYVFADEPGQESPSPERKYVFGSEELKKHYSKCSLGDSYSVWLPWDVVGGTSRQLTLITRFDATVGSTVMSDPAKKMLPGLAKSSNIDKVTQADSEGHSNATVPRPPAPLRPASDSLQALQKNDDPLPEAGSDRPATRPSKQSSIADFLKDQRAANPATGNALPNEHRSQPEVAQVGYTEFDSGQHGSVPTVNEKAANSRVETIQLGQLRSNVTSLGSLPPHLWNQQTDGVVEVGEVSSERQPDTSAGPSTTVSYGRPGETTPVATDVRSGPAPRSDFELGEESWPRRSRTMGSGRRSIAESRRDAMAERPKMTP